MISVEVSVDVVVVVLAVVVRSRQAVVCYTQSAVVVVVEM